MDLGEYLKGGGGGGERISAGVEVGSSTPQVDSSALKMFKSLNAGVLWNRYLINN